MRAVTDPLAYRDFYYPLNVFMHILTHEEGGVDYLHYGLFESAGESIAAAQERSTELLLARLPLPPARILEVGVGLATTLQRLTQLGYDAVGITPDEKQIAAIRGRYGDEVRVACERFESFAGDGRYDVVVLQESSQYIEAGALFAKAAELTSRLIVLDEFALQPVAHEGALHSLDRFLRAASDQGFALAEDLDLSARAAPTIDYFLQRIPRYRDLLMRDIGLTAEQVDGLVTSGEAYRDFYRRGVYGYRLLQFAR